MHSPRAWAVLLSVWLLLVVGVAAPERGARRRIGAAPARLPGAAVREVPLFRHRGPGHGPHLGLRRHPEPGPRAVLRAGRLRHGHVPHALHRRRGGLPQRLARLHGVPRLERAALVLVRLFQLPLRAGHGDAGARPAGLRVRLADLPLAHPGGLLLHRHPGAHLRRHVAVLPQQHRLRRQQRPHRLQAHPRLLAVRPRHPADPVPDLGGRAAARRTWPAGTSSPASWAAP